MVLGRMPNVALFTLGHGNGIPISGFTSAFSISASSMSTSSPCRTASLLNMTVWYSSWLRSACSISLASFNGRCATLQAGNTFSISFTAFLPASSLSRTSTTSVYCSMNSRLFIMSLTAEVAPRVTDTTLGLPLKLAGLWSYRLWYRDIASIRPSVINSLRPPFFCAMCCPHISSLPLRSPTLVIFLSIDLTS